MPNSRTVLIHTEHRSLVGMPRDLVPHQGQNRHTDHNLTTIGLLQATAPVSLLVLAALLVDQRVTMIILQGLVRLRVAPLTEVLLMALQITLILTQAIMPTK